MAVKTELVKKAIRHIKKIYECPVCSTTEDYKGAMNKHVRTHDPVEIANALGIELDEIIDDEEMYVYSV